MPKIQTLKLRNVRCFDDAEFDFNEFNRIAGDNEAGKSTIISSIIAALTTNQTGRTQYVDFIRHGEDFAEVTLILTDGTTIKRRFLPSNAGDSTVITDASGIALSKPAARLNGYANVFAVNPLRLTNLTPTEQVTMYLKALHPEDLQDKTQQMIEEIAGFTVKNGEAIEMINRADDQLMKGRRELKEKLAAEEAGSQAATEKIREGNVKLDLYRDLGDKQQSELHADLAGAIQTLQQIKEARKKNEEIQSKKTELLAIQNELKIEFEKRKSVLESELEHAEKLKEQEFEQYKRQKELELKEHLERKRIELEKKKEETEKDLLESVNFAGEKLKEATDELSRIGDPEPIQEEPDLEPIERDIKRCSDRDYLTRSLDEYGKTRARHIEKMRSLTVQIDDFTDKLHQIREIPARLIASANPIPGLTVTTTEKSRGGVELHLTWPNKNGDLTKFSDHSESAALEMCVRLAISASGELRTLLIDGAECCGSKRLDRIREIARENGAQLILTTVTDDGTIKFETEDQP